MKRVKRCQLCGEVEGPSHWASCPVNPWGLNPEHPEDPDPETIGREELRDFERSRGL